MELIDIPYELCSRYVRDERTVLEKHGSFNLIVGWIRNRDLARLASCTSLIPEALSSKDHMRVLMQIEAFYKKNSVYTSDGAAETALSTFRRGEKICRITNRRLDYYYTQRDRLDQDLSLWWSKAESYIRRILGSHDKFLGEIPRLVRVTAGATSTRSRRQSLPYLKIRKKLTATHGAVPYLTALSKYLGYGNLKVETTVSNRVEIVPKTFKTGRTIACEPEGNLPFQLAFDTWTKNQLRKRGIDLSDQSRNQQLALEASKSGRYATIDLSMASDTLAYNTVASLLPYDWFQYLSAIRSPCFQLEEGRVETYAKFSSMGNGATFSLETLIFAGACYAVGSKTFSVYGDDIIIETELVEDLLCFMRFLGFIINRDKSHVSGPFRESCGMNAYQGIDITPFYMRSVGKRKAYQCHNVNGLASIATPGGLMESWLLDYIKENNLPLVPHNEDSLSGIWIDVHTAYSEKILKVRNGITRFKAYQSRRTQKTITDSRTLFLWYMYSKNRMEFQILTKKMENRDAPADSTQRIDEREREPLVTSRVPMSSHKYVRKWVHWFPPVTGTPVHLYRWTELLIR